MLPHVVRFNGAECDSWYRELLSATAGEPNCPTGGTDALAEFLERISYAAGLASTLNECGVEHARLPRLAGEAAQQWTASFNPIPVTSAELLRLYESAY
jgi:alcohol dehydrogenase